MRSPIARVGARAALLLLVGGCNAIVGNDVGFLVSENGASGGGGMTDGGNGVTEAGATGGAGGAAGATGSGGSSSACPTGATVSGTVCTCPGHAPDVCKNECVDTKTDARYCGSCDKACAPGAACNDGACGDAPTELVAPVAGCGKVRVAAIKNFLYWTDPGQGLVQMMAVMPNAMVKLVQKGPLGDGITVDLGTQHVYWFANNGQGWVYSMPTGPDPIMPTIVLNEPAGEIYSIAPATDSVYVSYKNMVYKVPAGGGATTNVGMVQLGMGVSLTLSPGALAYTVRGPNNVESMDLTTGTTAIVAASQTGLLLDNIVSATNQIWWAVGPNLFTGKTGGMNGSIASTAKHGGAITAFAVGGAQKYFYFAEDGFIEKTPPQGAATIIARDQKAPTSIFADEVGHVFWATSDCAIRSLPDIH